jgi:uncharacterized membrane protein YfcA
MQESLQVVDSPLLVLVYVALVCALSGFAHGALGFGFPIVATPLVALVIDMKSAITLLAPVTLVLVVITVLRGGGFADLARRYWFMPVAIGLGAWLGTRLLLAAPPEPFTLVLALVLLFYLNLDRLGRGHSAAVEKHRAIFGTGFAFVAGIFEAIANVAGPMLLVYFMLLGAAPAQMVQTLNLCFSVGKGTQVATLAAAAALPPFAWLAGLTVPSLAGLAVGMRLRSRIDAQTYRAWLRKALWVMTVLLIAQFTTQAFASEAFFRHIEAYEEPAAVRLVEARQVDPGARNSAGETALHRAVEKGMRGLARALVAAGAQIDARAKNGETALHLASLHHEADFTDILLAAGADPRAVSADGETPLHWAALSGHIVVAQRLIARGADVNAADRRGNTPLHAAAHGGYYDLAKLLLTHNARRDAKNGDGVTPRDYALVQNHPSVARLLERVAQ